MCLNFLHFFGESIFIQGFRSLTEKLFSAVSIDKDIIQVVEAKLFNKLLIASLEIIFHGLEFILDSLDLPFLLHNCLLALDCLD